MLNQLLPISFATPWFTEINNERCSNKLRSWLYDQCSLTEKLEKRCYKFHVEIKQQITINPKEITLSGYFIKEPELLVREVLLYCDGIPVVFAQTEIPFSTLTDEQAALAKLGQQSLGRVLFQDKSMRRGSIEVSEFSTNSVLHAFSASLEQACEHSLWARRSLFYINNKPLLVSELFLPASGIYNA